MATFTATTVRDLRSVTVQTRLREEWRDRIKHLGPAQREAWLHSQEGIVALGAKVCRDLCREIELKRARVNSAVASAAIADAYDSTGELPAGLEFGRKNRVISVTNCRRYAVRLQLSRAEVNIGAGTLDAPLRGVGTRRWTPPQAVELEDYLDGLSPDRAAWESASWPSSGSAIVLQRCEVIGATPANGNW